jgi:PAS domain-containing protein
MDSWLLPSGAFVIVAVALVVGSRVGARLMRRTARNVQVTRESSHQHELKRVTVLLRHLDKQLQQSSRRNHRLTAIARELRRRAALARQRAAVLTQDVCAAAAARVGEADARASAVVTSARIEIAEARTAASVFRDLLTTERGRADRLRAFTARALVATDFDGLFADAASLAAESVGADTAAVFELGGIPLALHLRAAAGWRPGALLSLNTDGDGLGGYALASNDAVVVNDLLGDLRFAAPPSLVAEGVRAGIITAINASDAPTRLLGVFTREPTDFAADAVVFVRQLAALLGIVGAREQAATRAAEVASLNEAIVRTSPTPVLMLDEFGRVTSANAAAAEQFAMPPQLIAKTPVTELLAPAPGPEGVDLGPAIQAAFHRFAGLRGRVVGRRYSGEHFDAIAAVAEIRQAGRRQFVVTVVPRAGSDGALLLVPAAPEATAPLMRHTPAELILAHSVSNTSSLWS